MVDSVWLDPLGGECGLFLAAQRNDCLFLNGIAFSIPLVVIVKVRVLKSIAVLLDSRKSLPMIRLTLRLGTTMNVL